MAEIPNTYSIDSCDDEVDVALLFLLQAMKKKRDRKYGKNSKKKYVPRCFDCNEKGNLRSDCPKLDKEKGKASEDSNKGNGKYKRSNMEQKGNVFVAIKVPESSSSSNAKGKTVSFSSKLNVIPNENESDEDDGKFYFNNVAFDNAEDAFNATCEFIEVNAPKANKTKKDFKKLIRDHEAQQRALDLMTLKFTEARDTLRSYDSTLFDNMEIELGKTKEYMSSLELKNSELESKLANGTCVNPLPFQARGILH